MKMNSTLGYTSMKKSLFLTLLIPLLLTSCGRNGVSLSKMRSRIDGIEDTHEHPYYKVVGSIDIAGMVTEITEEDGTFDKMPNGQTYVANARYNEGFYNATAERMTMLGVSDYDEEDIIIYGMSSRAYWSRMPIRLHKDNFYAEREITDKEGNIKKELNKSCGYANLLYYITAWIDAYGSINASTNRMYMELLPGGGFAFGGDNVRTQILIDNYPCYMNFETNGDIIGSDEWEEDFPLPCYSYNGSGFIDGRFNIRFVYDKDGWLQSEYVATSDYDYRKTTQGQLAFKAVYSYKFS